METYDVSEISVRANKGAPRVWIETKRLERAGFASGTRYTVQTGEGRLVLTVKPDGTRVVSAHKKGERSYPVIDLNSASDLSVFTGLEKVRVIFRKDEIHLLPLATQKKAAERLERLETKVRENQPIKVVSLCHGGGVLSDALRRGMQRWKVDTHLTLANDIDRDVLHHAAEVNPSWEADTIAASAPLQEIVTDDFLIQRVGKVEMLEAGLPCVAASLAGRAKKHLAMAEADENAGHLVVMFLGLIEKLQPAIVVLENVPPYANTASAHLIRHTLPDWGYSVSEGILAAGEFGCLEDRKRMCMVAITAGLHFDFGSIEKPAGAPVTLGDILEAIPEDDPRWNRCEYLKAKEERDKEAGKGFRMQVLGPEATAVGTIGAEYQKNRSTEPKVAHPSDPDLMRLLTPLEHARCKGVDPQLVEGLPATRAHRLLGNSIAYPPFVEVGAAIAKAIRLHINREVEKAATASDIESVCDQVCGGGNCNSCPHGLEPDLFGSRLLQAA